MFDYENFKNILDIILSIVLIFAIIIMTFVGINLENEQEEVMETTLQLQQEHINVLKNLEVKIK